MNIGNTIKRIRKEKKINQAVLADQCGITRTYLSLIENNKYEPNISLLKTIAKKLEVPLSVLLIASLQDDEEVPENKKQQLKEATDDISLALLTLFLNDN